MKKMPRGVLSFILIGILAAAGWRQFADPGVTGPEMAVLAADAPAAAGEHKHPDVKLWEPLTSDRYAQYEKIALCANVVVALAGLAYAWMLVGQVKQAPRKC